MKCVSHINPDLRKPDSRMGLAVGLPCQTLHKPICCGPALIGLSCQTLRKPICVTTGYLGLFRRLPEMPGRISAPV